MIWGLIIHNCDEAVITESETRNRPLFQFGKERQDMDNLAKNTELSSDNIKKLNDLMKGMRFGTVTIIVQDGKIIQIDKTEKHRL